MNGYEDVSKLGKENVDVALESAGAISKGIQAIAAESGDFSKKSFEAGSSALEKLIAAPSLDKAVEVQTEFLRSAYEDYVGQMTKVGEIFTGMAKDAYKPYESYLGKLGG